MLARLRERAQSDGTEPRFTPDQTARVIREFCAMFPDIEYRGGHVTLADDNLEVVHIAWCIRECLAQMGTDDDRGYSAEAIDFLACLLCLDDDERMDDDQEAEE